MRMGRESNIQRGLVETVRDCRRGVGGAKSKPDGSALTYFWLLFIRWFWLCGSVGQTFINHTD